MGNDPVTTTCCIAGGGPAGIMLGLLLSRAGIGVAVLEKHADFFRDFRGDTLHPSTLELMHELGMLEDLLKLPHTKYRTLAGRFGKRTITVADFSHLPTRCKFIALMPQWDFLNFLTEKARAYPGFKLFMEHDVRELIRQDGRIAGAIANSPRGRVKIRADLTVGADGRHSAVRQQAGLEVIDLGAPIDVLWMRISRRPDDPAQGLGNLQAGRVLVLLPRGDYFQCGMVIPKGSADEIKQKGLPAFQALVAEIVPFLSDRVHELDNWEKIKLLSVQINRLRKWSMPGLLCIGDAAHAMSPIGGVGINLAIQDAVAAANILAAPLKERCVTEDILQRVQKRREWPVRVTQRAQVFIQNRLFGAAARKRTNPNPVPFLLRWLPGSMRQRLAARVVGMGVRPEHIELQQALSTKSEIRNKFKI